MSGMSFIATLCMSYWHHWLQQQLLLALWRDQIDLTKLHDLQWQLELQGSSCELLEIHVNGVWAVREVTNAVPR